MNDEARDSGAGVVLAKVLARRVLGTCAGEWAVPGPETTDGVLG